MLFFSTRCKTLCGELKKHIDEVCPIYRECDDNGCVKRHPKQCKYYAKNKKCIFQKCAYSHDKEGNDLEIEIIEKQVSALKHEVEELKEANKEKLDNVRVEARANTRLLAELMRTVKEVVQQLNSIEQEQTNYTEKEEIVSKATDEIERNTDKDQNESIDSGINKSGAADDKIHMKGDSLEITEAKNNINIKEIEKN